MEQIITVAYNNFDDILPETIRDEEVFYALLKNFKDNGGNLDFPIKQNRYSMELVTAYKWFKDKTDSDLERKFINKLFNNNILSSPIKVKVENDTVFLNSVYNDYWFRDEAKPYSEHIAKKFQQFLTEFLSLKKLPTKMSYARGGDIKVRDASKEDILFTFADMIKQKKVYDTLFTKMPEIKKLWQVTEPYDQISHSLNLHSINKDNFDNVMVFYKHGMLLNYFKKPENTRSLRTLVEYLIRYDDIEMLKLINKDFNLKELESTQEGPYHAFLVSAKSRKMANYLMENDTLVVGKNVSDSVFSDSRVTNIEVFEAILDNPKYIHLFKDNQDHFYDKYVDRHDGKEITSLLIKKYKFNILDYDMLKVGFDQDEEEGIKHYLNLGADPRNCEAFIEKMAGIRDHGGSMLKRLKKGNHFNSFYPDPLFNILKHSSTKANFTWLERATFEEFTRYTKDGKPAWWGITNTYGLNLVKSNITDFSQEGKKGGSYFTHLADYIIKNKVEGYDDTNLNIKNTINMMNSNQINNNLPLLDISHSNEKRNNIFHSLFLASNDYSDKANNFVDALFAFDYPKAGELLNQKNNNGKTPLEILLDLTVNCKKMGYNYESLFKKIVAKYGNDIDFQIKGKNGKNFYENIIENNMDLVEDVKFFNSLSLSKSLDKTLDKTDNVVKKPKL